MDKESKNLYIIPGFNETVQDENYQEVTKYAKQLGFEIISIVIDWNNKKDMNEYIKQASGQLPDRSQGYVLGFSFGAYITYTLSLKKKFSGYIFCTVSPYFNEKIKDIPIEAKKYFGSEFMKGVENNHLHNGNNSRAWFLTGQKDWPLAIETNQEANQRWAGNSDFILVKNASHELSQNNYVEEVKWILKNLAREKLRHLTMYDIKTQDRII